MRILTLILAVGVCACVSEDDRVSSSTGVIRIGVLPDQSNTALSRRYTPLANYLETTVGLDMALTILTDYQDLLDQFNAGRIDLANFGGITFVQAERTSGALPLVMRDIDLQFKSCYLVKASDSRRSVAEFEGETFAFGPALSTSGHIMPRHFLALNGVLPEIFFASVRHSSAHDQTAHWVADGTVAIGVANCDIAGSMVGRRQILADELRILEMTPPYADYVWAAQPSLDAAVRNRLRDAFLALDMTDPSHRALLAAMGSEGYLPAGKRDFDEVRIAARESGLLD